MLKYSLENTIKRISRKAKDADVILLTTYEAKEHIKNAKMIEHIRYSKAEAINGITRGNLHIPDKGEDKTYIDVYFLICKNKVILVDDTLFVEKILCDMEKEGTLKESGKGAFLATFLEKIVKDDTYYLTYIEEELEKLEENIFLEEDEKKLNRRLGDYRRKTMTMANFYLQLADVAEILRQDDNDIFNTTEEKYLTLFMDKVKRLHDEALLIREYAIQLREVYQAQIDEKQNSIMKMLTIVTTIFFPLSIITGWYGMNFTGMPELNWKYGYMAVIGFSILVVCICTWIFKKKKFW